MPLNHVPPSLNPARPRDPNSEIRAEARRQRAIDPEDVVRLLDRDLIEYDPADGTPINVARLVRHLLVDRPYLRDPDPVDPEWDRINDRRDEASARGQERVQTTNDALRVLARESGVAPTPAALRLVRILSGDPERGEDPPDPKALNDAVRALNRGGTSFSAAVQSFRQRRRAFTVTEAPIRKEQP